jgi:putative endonuclease
MKGFVYILANKHNTVLYTGVTSDLKERIKMHLDKKFRLSFSSRYNVTKLVYFEKFNSIIEAIIREKQIKGGSRKSKDKLITSVNPEWKDLYEGICRDSEIASLLRSSQ